MQLVALRPARRSCAAISALRRESMGKFKDMVREPMRVPQRKDMAAVRRPDNVAVPISPRSSRAARWHRRGRQGQGRGRSSSSLAVRASQCISQSSPSSRRATLSASGRAKPAAPQDRQKAWSVSCGIPLEPPLERGKPGRWDVAPEAVEALDADQGTKSGLSLAGAAITNRANGQRRWRPTAIRTRLLVRPRRSRDRSR